MGCSLFRETASERQDVAGGSAFEIFWGEAIEQIRGERQVCAV
jgi:hypothetical protein